MALPGPGCYPYREPLPAPPPGGPPPGPPAYAAGPECTDAADANAGVRPGARRAQSAPAQPTPTGAGQRFASVGCAVGVAAVLVAATAVVASSWPDSATGSVEPVVAYFENSNGVFVGDDVRIRGVNVGKIDSDRTPAHPGEDRILDRRQVPGTGRRQGGDLVTDAGDRPRLQLTPPYTRRAHNGRQRRHRQDRTAVPVEWDDFRASTGAAHQDTAAHRAGGVSTLGALINTTAENLRGQGPAIHDALIKLSQTVSSLGDHSDDTFTTVKNLATLMSALQAAQV